MRRRRHVPHEITLYAFTDDETGRRSIYDIVETCRRRASYFARRWIRDPSISAMLATGPGVPLQSVRSDQARELRHVDRVPA